MFSAGSRNNVSTAQRTVKKESKMDLEIENYLLPSYTFLFLALMSVDTLSRTYLKYLFNHFTSLEIFMKTPLSKSLCSFHIEFLKTEVITRTTTHFLQEEEGLSPMQGIQYILSPTDWAEWDVRYNIDVLFDSD